jgi:PAS domain S-box-containing protein
MKGTRILVVEDEFIIGTDIQDILRNIGYDVPEIVPSGEKAIERAEELKPDIILMDIVLSGEIDGIDAVERIQEKHDIPVIYLTAHTDDVTFQRARDTNPYGYLIKPTRKSDLYTAIETALHRHEMEVQLRESEERYRTMLEHIEEGYFEVDLSGHYTFSNDAFCKIFRFTRDELYGMSYKKHMDESTAREIYKIYNEMYRKKERTKRYDLEVIRKDGSMIITEAIASLIIDSSGKPVGFRGIVRDITERKNIENMLRESEAKYRKQFDEALDAIFVANAETGILIDCNNAATRLVGRERSELIGKHQRILHPQEEYREEFSSSFKLHLKEKEGQSIETQVIKRNGEIRDVSIKANLFESNGKKFLQGIFRDITEMKNAEKTMKLQHDLAIALSGVTELKDALTLVLDAAITIEGMDSGGIYLLDKDSGAFDLACSKVLSAEFIEIVSHWDKDSDKAGMIMKGKPSYTKYDKEFLKKRGLSPRDIRIREGLKSVAVIPILHRGEVVACMNIASHEVMEIPDIARNYLETIASQVGSVIVRLRAEETIKDALKENELLIKEIHHRVKNNLQIMSSLLELQERRIKDKELQKIYKDSKNQIRSIALVHERLYNSEDLAKIDFAGYIKAMTKELYKTYLCDPKRLGIQIEAENIQIGIDKAIPCGLIVNELISNAIKHAFPEGLKRKGKIIISLKEKGNKVEMTVKDNGMGIPENIDVKKVNSMGLLLLRLLTDQLNGKFELIRKKGTSFTITFQGNA